jgi:SAM-dependent methyltransferase
MRSGTLSGVRRKDHAVELHTDMAGEFALRYETLVDNPYSNTFTYGRKKIEELLDLVVKDLPAGARVLDAGCGTGFTLHKLAGRGFDVVGSEPSEGMRAQARSLYPDIPMVGGDIEDLSFPSGTFDLVISIEVIRYLPGSEKALSELARVLRPGGTAFVTATPRYALNGYALVSAITSRVAVPTFTKVETSFLTTRSAQRALLDAGFRQSEIHGRFIGPWHVLGRIAPRSVPPLLRRFEPWDDKWSDRDLTRDLANHLVLIGRR